jgi:hypothetical protein
MKKLLAITLWIALAPAESHAASLMPQGKQAYHAASGAPLAGGKVYTYAAGTSTPLATYSDQAGATPNANPVVLDSRGEASIFWGAGPYKVTLRTSADALVWTQDNLYPPFTAGGAAALYNGGSAAAPELTWGGDLDSGFYIIGEDNIGLSLGGTKRWDYAAAGSTLTGTLGVSGATTLSSTLAVGGATTFTGAAAFSSTVAVTGASTFTGAAAFSSTLSVADPVTLSSTLTGAAAAFDSVTAGTLTVANAATFIDPVTVATPTAEMHAATKAYVDSYVAVVTTVSIDIGSIAAEACIDQAISGSASVVTGSDCISTGPTTAAAGLIIYPLAFSGTSAMVRFCANNGGSAVDPPPATYRFRCFKP